MTQKDIERILYEAYFNTKHEFSDDFKQKIKEYYATKNRSYAAQMSKFILADTSYKEVISKNKRNLKISCLFGLIFGTITPIAISHENYKLAIGGLVGTSLAGLISAGYYLHNKARKSWVDKLDTDLNDQVMYQFLDKYKKEIESKII